MFYIYLLPWIQTVRRLWNKYAPKGVDYVSVALNRDLGGMFISMPYVHHVTVTESCSVMFDTLQPHGIVHGILQARILERVAVPFSRGSSQPRDQTQVSGIAGVPLEKTPFPCMGAWLAL